MKMAILGSRVFSLHAISSTIASFTSKTTHKAQFGASNSSWKVPGPLLRRSQATARAQARATWLPGLDPPPYLDGTLAGDYGFDPLGLGEDPGSLRWYVQAELVHARFAMAGIAGILFTDLLRVTGISKVPVWFEAGAVKYEFANTETLFIVQLLLMGYAETKRYMDFKSPGSQAREGSFFGLEAALEGLEPGYPGGPLLNPLGLAKDIKNAHDWKLKEIKNGRLAMVAMLGIFVQANVTHVGPINNLDWGWGSPPLPGFLRAHQKSRFGLPLNLYLQTGGAWESSHLRCSPKIKMLRLRGSAESSFQASQ